MTRRSTPQSKIDRDAWPVVVRVLVPPEGFFSLGSENDPHDWCRVEFGLTEFATVPHGHHLREGVAFNFRTLDQARRFLERFPMLELDDRTTTAQYYSPYLPFGRRSKT